MDKKSEQQDPSAWRIFRLVADDAGRFFPYLLVFYVAMLVAKSYWPTMRGYFYWPAFHVLFGLVTFAALSSAAFRVTARSVREEGRLTVIDAVRQTFNGVATTFFTAFGAAAPHFKRWGWSEYAKFAVSIALVVWAAASGAGILDVLMLIFGCGVVLFGIVDEYVPYALAGATIFALPILQPFVSREAFSVCAAIAFEAFCIAILFTCMRLFSSKNEVFHRQV